METVMTGQDLRFSKIRLALAAALNGLAFVLPLSIALSNVMGGAALLLWGILLVGDRPRYRWTGLEWPYLAGFGTALVAALFSVSPDHSLHSLRRESLVVFFLLASQTGDGPALKKRLGSFAAGATLAACWGILQTAVGVEPSSLRWVSPHPPPVWMSALPSGLARLFYLHAGRAQGFFSHPITFAEMLVMAGGLILGLWLVDRRWARLLACVAVGGGILFSQTRSVWLALFFALGTWIVIRREKKVLAVTLICAAVFGAGLGFSPALRGRAASIVDTEGNQSNLIRMGLWDKSIELIRQNPILGIGGGNFLVEGRSLRYGGAEPDSKWTETHNMYLQMAVGRGLPGLAAFLWFLSAMGRLLWKAGRANPSTLGIFFGFVGLLVAGLTESWTNDSEVVMSLYFLAGTAWALGARGDDKGSI